MAHKESNVNWFGQVGGSRAVQPRPQVSAPTLSQIPGLNKASGDASYADEPQRQFFRDTDSAYVRLAKQGGRTDLLRMDQDSAAADTKGSGYAVPSWMQQDSANEDLHSTVERVTCAENTCFPPARVSETRAAYTGDTLYKAWSRSNRGTSPSHQFLRKKASIYRMPTNAEMRLTLPGKPCELEEMVKPGNYEGNRQSSIEPQTLPDGASLPRTPAFGTPFKNLEGRQVLPEDEKPLAAMHYRSEPISRTVTEEKGDWGSDAAQFYQGSTAESELEMEKQNEDETRVELIRQTGSVDSRMEASDIDTEMRSEADYAGTELHHQDSTAKDKDDLDFDNGGRVAQWDSRQNSPPPGDQNSSYSWSRRMSAEGDRQPMQTESQSAYANKQSKDGDASGNWHSDQFQRQYSRQNISDAASDAGRTSFQSPEQKPRDNTRPDWLQWNAANNGRRESANGRQHEDYTDSRGSPNGQRYQGNGSPQKPYADHGYQMPFSTETSSAYSEKPFQSPAGDRRSLTSKLPEELYNKSSYPGSSQQKPSVTPNHQQQPAGVNRLKHSDSMSKLMSFGYLKDADKDSTQLAAGLSQPRFERDYSANSYTTEYKEKMHGTGDATDTNSIRSRSGSIPSAGGYVPTPISDPGYRRRKQSFDERPDFFKIGSTEPQSTMAYGIRKPSAEARPDFFGSERVSSAATTVSYGKTKHDADSKPDFFKIGSLDNYVERKVEEKKPDDGGILDKLNGYHGIPQKTSFRRRKMDINGPMLTMPVKAISRF